MAAAFSMLTSFRALWYTEPVAAKSATGFDSPNIEGGHTATIVCLAVFLCTLHGLPFWAAMWEALCLPVSFGVRSVNLHSSPIFRLTAEWAGFLNSTKGVTPCRK